jgi:hypothetical protein
MVRPLGSLHVQTLQHLWTSHLLLLRPCYTLGCLGEFQVSFGCRCLALLRICRAGLVVILLGVGINLVLSTSQVRCLGVKCLSVSCMHADLHSSLHRCGRIHDMQTRAAHRVQPPCNVDAKGGYFLMCSWASKLRDGGQRGRTFAARVA